MPSEAATAGAGSMVIGAAPTGGALPQHWMADIEAAMDAGLDIVSGMHTPLMSFPDLAEKAHRRASKLIDVRQANKSYPVATGDKRTGRRLLTVGTDCALGKKYTALALTRALQSRGVDATFRATGQTGIMIAGQGIPMDSVVSDFLAGAAEQLSPDNAANHWDVIEGQGSLLHPGFAAVTLGLLHGSQPDAIVLCHEPSRLSIDGRPGYLIPPLAEVIDLYLHVGRLTNRTIRCVGVSINSSELHAGAWHSYREALRRELQLAVCDPVRDGAEDIVSALLRA
jgi:D-glutamate N-acetyltransferase